MTVLRTSALTLLGLLWGASGCDRSPAPELTAEPRASATNSAVDAPAVAVPAAAAPKAAAPEVVIVEPIGATGGSPATVGSAPSSVAPASASAGARITKSPADPNNPCAERYEERTDASGKVTRVLLPKDKRCNYKGEGGISPRGTVYGY